MGAESNFSPVSFWVTTRRLFILAVLCGLLGGTVVCAADTGQVLILHSYHPGLRWTDGIMAAMQDRLLKHHPGLSLHVEYLDTKRYPGSEYLSTYVEGVLPRKLAGLHFDLVLTSDNDAFSFVRRHRNDLFAGVPIVFCGVNGFTPQMIAGLGGITGVGEFPSFDETIKLALRLQPATRELILIGETQTETGREIDRGLHRLKAHLSETLPIRFWNDRPLEKLIVALGQLKKGQVVLLASVLRKSSGEVLSYAESARQVHDHTVVPIYGVWDFFLGQGIVGGYITSSQAQGDLAAVLGLQILAGESPDNLPVIQAGGNRYMFDANELRRFSIPQDRLPAGSIFINQPVSFYRLHKWQFWAGMVILFLLCCSLVLLSTMIAIRRKAAIALAERARLASLGAEIGRILTRGGDLHGTLQACTQALVEHTETVFGRIWIVSENDPELLELRASAGLYTRIDGRHCHKRIGESKVGLIARDRRPILSNNLMGDPLFTDQEWICQEGIVGFAGYPLVVKERLVGVTGFFSKKPITATVQASIASVADTIAVGIERHRAEDALQGAFHAAEASRDNLDAILLSVADGLIVTDLENRVVLINQSAEELLDIHFSEACGLPFETALQGKTFAVQLGKLLRNLLAENSLELALSGSGCGETRTLLVHTAPVYRSDQSIGGTVAILRDVTRERALDQLKSEFIAIAAHELRTPLTTILGYAELLLAEQDAQAFTQAQREEYLGYIVQKSEILEKIIEELLDLGRIETGRTLVLDSQPCEMIVMVKQIVGHFQKETRQHQFDVICPLECLELRVDQAKMQRVFDNLLSNAVKYSPAGGTIQVEGRVVDGWLEVSITDKGIGMTSEQVARAFDKFYRADTANTAVSGLGLGLTLCKGIIEAHGGFIWIESTLGQGSRLTFRLPL
ncbi:ATP-binding protein [Geopsychrobacter electrodiphilus]|uniref:ATP-binding protein n=1 Tax=Geopsychrobacter electrodiphilus TaxID=225196 RepID=UPI0003786EAB|nr:ATP-binding protein [Geopsychrobacter electrodiphilus]